MFAFGQTGSGKTFTISQLERLVAKSLFDGTLSGEMKVHVSIFELAGNSAFGKSYSLQLSLTYFDRSDLYMPMPFRSIEWPCSLLNIGGLSRQYPTHWHPGVLCQKYP